MPAGYRTFRQLAPGPWFKSCATPAEYCQRYYGEILAHLDPLQVAEQIAAKAEGRIPVLVCFEAPNSGKWCHRSLAAEWLARALGRVVPEFGYEHLPQDQHPLLPSSVLLG